MHIWAAYSIVSDPKWQNIEIMQGIMHVFVTSNFKKHQIDSSGKSRDINFVDAQGQLTLYSVVGVGRNFKLTHAFMYVLVTC